MGYAQAAESAAGKGERRQQVAAVHWWGEGCRPAGEGQVEGRGPESVGLGGV